MKKILVLTLIAVVGLTGGLTAYMMLLFRQMSPVSQGAPIPEFASGKGKAALLVIDVQEGLTGDLAGSFSKDLKDQSEALIGSINKAVAWAEANQMPVIYIRQESTNVLYNLLTGGLTAKGSPASQIDKRVRITGSTVFGKQKMDAFWNPELDSFLLSREIDRLYVTGLDAAYCVDRTIKGALARGYNVTAVKDAIISSTPEQRDELIVAYAAAGVGIITSDELGVQKSVAP